MLIEKLPYQDPIILCQTFAHTPGTVFLDSAMEHVTLGRYSYLAIDPFKQLCCQNTRYSPFDTLSDYIDQYKDFFYPDPTLPPFQGGLAGFLSYELCHYLEQLPRLSQDSQNIPDIYFGIYDLVISFDQLRKQAWIISSGLPETQKEKRIQRAKKRYLWAVDQIAAIKNNTLREKFIYHYPIRSNFNRYHYLCAVKKTIDYILAGDIFEANISQRFSCFFPQARDPFQLYNTLRINNPAPFAAFINTGTTQILSASPERFLHLHNQQIESRPIKGTIARSEDKSQDELNYQKLLTSEKDRAENVMIVDLMRNDLSRVCLNNSIKVPVLCGIESYKTVHHLVSVVTGTLNNQFSSVDLLKATFPGGSITGAPKIRAMEIITEIEQITRGPYCGSIGYLGFDGNLDLSITIRTYTLQNQIITFNAGGAIVADSHPQEEFLETIAKAKALIGNLR